MKLLQDLIKLNEAKMGTKAAEDITPWDIFDDVRKSKFGQEFNFKRSLNSKDLALLNAIINLSKADELTNEKFDKDFLDCTESQQKSIINKNPELFKNIAAKNWKNKKLDWVGIIEQQLDEASIEDKADSFIQKIANGTGIAYRKIQNVFCSGSGEGNGPTLAKLEKDGYNSGGAWPENQKWFKKHGITKAEYNAICKLDESVKLTEMEEEYDSEAFGELIDKLEDCISDANAIISNKTWKRQIANLNRHTNTDEAAIASGEIATSVKKLLSMISQFKSHTDV